MTTSTTNQTTRRTTAAWRDAATPAVFHPPGAIRLVTPAEEVARSGGRRAGGPADAPRGAGAAPRDHATTGGDARRAEGV